MSEGVPGEKRGGIISFRDRDELEKKRNVRKDLERASGALTLAYEGKGGLSVPSEKEKSDIMDLLGRVKAFEQDILKNRLTSDTLGDVVSVIAQVRGGLSKYLSDEQFLKVFGTDNLA